MKGEEGLYACYFCFVLVTNITISHASQHLPYVSAKIHKAFVIDSSKKNCFEVTSVKLNLIHTQLLLGEYIANPSPYSHTFVTYWSTTFVNIPQY